MIEHPLYIASEPFLPCAPLVQPCNLQGLILLRKYPVVTILPMPAYHLGVKIFLSVVERIFPSGLVRLLLAAFPMQKNNPDGRT